MTEMPSTDMSSEDTEITAALENFCNILLGFGHEQLYPRGELKRRIGVRFLLPRPSEGSACKRMNLFLRWMVRPEDGVDCGVWTSVAPRQLIIPLDTHIARISSYIGLTSMRSPGWSMISVVETNTYQLLRMSNWRVKSDIRRLEQKRLDPAR